ncbi:DUF2750 domain-containing protein [Frigidibacter sp. SD6-1]|uniref:DUF2750 domain-containing protein n=1 Tax=Frigidibacter sp. SD6-1 TaxID=3032581 RepID=UPI0024DFBBE0|nr:DUF2750 domain-containing protein [Frigidibacter sp. SD6-1]
MALKDYKSARQRKIWQSIPDEERRADRRPLTQTERHTLLSMAASDRYDYLLREMCAREEGWAAFGPQDMAGWLDPLHDLDVVPVWPHSELASSMEIVKRNSWDIVPIPVVDWIDEIIPKLIESENFVCAFPTNNGEFIVRSGEQFAKDLEAHWNGFAKSLAAP